MPNTSLIIIVVIALLKGRKTGSIIGLIMGLLQDIVFSPVIGVNYIYILLDILLAWLRTNYQKTMHYTICYYIRSTIGYHLFYYLFMFFRAQFKFFCFFKKIVIFETVYNSLLSILFYKWFSKIFIIPSIRFRRK